MSTDGNRILIVSRRLLVAEGIKSLLEGEPGISQIEIKSNFAEAIHHARTNPPDTIVLDQSSSLDVIIDQPITVDGREVNTIVLQELNGKARLYAHPPGRVADMENLILALKLGEQREEALGTHTPGDIAERTGLRSVSQPINLMMASASGPSNSRIPSSKSVL